MRGLIPVGALVACFTSFWFTSSAVAQSPVYFSVPGPDAVTGFH
jgi:hypothetical protein